MKCPGCGLEMFVYGAVSRGENVTREYVCGNKLCPRFDERMRKKTAPAAVTEPKQAEIC